MAEEPPEEALGRIGIAPILQEDVHHLTMLIHGSPEVFLLASDPHKHLVEMPRPPRSPLSPPQLRAYPSRPDCLKVI